MIPDQLLSVKEAEKIVLNEKIELSTEVINLQDSMGRILMEPVIADRDFPPFDRVMMDGIAIKYEEDGVREFKIAGFQAAGSPRQKLKRLTDCFEVMTGAVLPDRTDTVIPYECLEIQGEVARIISNDIKVGQYIHKKGSDRNLDSELLTPGIRITPAEIGVLATVGKAMVKVLVQPKIAIVSTGDELVPIDETPEPHQIRRSNSYALLGALRQARLHGDTFHLGDKKQEIKQKLDELLDIYDVLILSGGVSKGKKDYIPIVLEELNVKKLFHRIAQRPGKPFWFGKSEKAVIFGFPGNPVSTFLCFYRYFMPWYFSNAGLKQQKQHYAILAEDVNFPPRLTYFLQVKLKNNEHGNILAMPHAGKGSGDLTNLLEADGFIELPADKDSFSKGSAYPCFYYRS